jgi:molybdopterin-biosynthesis enzyme MoeA-like protein
MTHITLNSGVSGRQPYFAQRPRHRAGMIVKKTGNCRRAAGPPYEMSQMYEKYVEPFLKRAVLPMIHSRVRAFRHRRELL